MSAANRKAAERRIRLRYKGGKKRTVAEAIAEARRRAAREAVSLQGQRKLK